MMAKTTSFPEDRGNNPKRKVTYLGVAFPEGSESTKKGGYLEQLDAKLRERPGTYSIKHGSNYGFGKGER